MGELRAERRGHSHVALMPGQVLIPLQRHRAHRKGQKCTTCKKDADDVQKSYNEYIIIARCRRYDHSKPLQRMGLARCWCEGASEARLAPRQTRLHGLIIALQRVRESTARAQLPNNLPGVVGTTVVAGDAVIRPTYLLVHMASDVLSETAML